ncbi:hypothetical protein CPT_Margaery124 [Citrobacter phage Margaery]|uniref:Uncharacterized protein n=1 Tax=Citrobacter phage Margaery TaxID=1701810 RepID=A0A0M3UL95_9CAUD|nr:hypothetical protein CPT_Margaery124 [Citrobacter phage Margaery]ALF01813.1 hypothetical protein CPT_Margaery124 [Citrobacter phage Margaery]
MSPATSTIMYPKTAQENNRLTLIVVQLNSFFTASPINEQVIVPKAKIQANITINAEVIIFFSQKKAPFGA